jgi:hypothetical protein
VANERKGVRPANKYRPKLAAAITQRLDIERRAATAAIAMYQSVGVEKEESYAAVLFDKSIAISPLMRYCVSMSIGGEFKKIARQFEPDAILQFMRYPAEYKRVWKAVLPKGFTVRARRIYPYLLKDLGDSLANASKQVKAPEERRAQLDAVKLDEMMAIVIQNEEAYDAVSEILTIKHARRISEGHALVWKKVRAYRKTHGELPAKGSLVADLNNALGENPDALTDDEKQEVDDFIQYAYDVAEHGKDITKSRAHVRVATETCRQFLEEETIHDLREMVIRDGSLPTDLPGVLQQKQAELDIIGSLTNGELEKPFPLGWDTREHIRLFTTGCSSLNDLTGGGWRGGEVILFMGPYGSCKTTMVVDSCANLISYAAQEVIEGRTQKRGDKPMTPVVVLMFTEGEKQDYRLRLLANLAKIPWQRLLRMHDLNELCKIPKKVGCTEETKYELAKFAQHKANKGKGFFPEYERVQIAIDLCNKYLVLLDCTNSEDNPHPIGSGGIDELANVVAGHFRKNKNTYPLAFWLDHASALVDRMAEAGGETIDKIMHLILKRIPRQCKDRLAKKWKAPVGIIHQLSGEANSRSIMAELSHSDAAGSKQIGEYVDFAIITNKPDNEQMARMKCTKHRREPPNPQRVVHVDGAFQRLTDITADYDIIDGRIVALDGAEAAPEMKLFLSLAEAKENYGGRHDDSFFPVLTCRSCGQHFFEKWYKDLECSKGAKNQLKDFDHGNATQNDDGSENAYWSTSPSETGTRLVVTNRLLEEADGGPSTKSGKWPKAYFCRQ